jgi:uncharacterized protein (TIGR03084 family)
MIQGKQTMRQRLAEVAPMSRPTDVFTDILAEGAALDTMITELDAGQWAADTPAAGWTVRHQIAHLTSTFNIAGLAATDPDKFTVLTAGADKDYDGVVLALLSPHLSAPPAELLDHWQAAREGAVTALAALPSDQIVPWVRPMRASVLGAVGIMELFGHGQDIADALGVPRTYTDRIGHLAWLATLNRDFGYRVRGLVPPTTKFRYDLTAPSGAVWEFGPVDSEERITGPAVDFCLLVTRRRHRADLALKAEGRQANQWLDFAQAYIGSPGTGRMPGQFR